MVTNSHYAMSMTPLELERQKWDAPFSFSFRDVPPILQWIKCPVQQKIGQEWNCLPLRAPQYECPSDKPFCLFGLIKEHQDGMKTKKGE